MIPGKFTYFAPSTLQEAVALPVERGSGAEILARGQSLIPAMPFRLSVPGIIEDRMYYFCGGGCKSSVEASPQVYITVHKSHAGL